MDKAFVIGLDYGSDSVRAILVDALSGEQIAEAVHNYRRWGKGLYCDAARSRFRQHPLDYIEGLHAVLGAVMAGHRDIAPYVRAIAVDTTASTPSLADEHLVPLALHEKYADNPDAMFVLWKDHTGEQESAEIERACYANDINYLQVSGYHYSAECYWSKVLHVLRSSEELRRDAFTVVELCDWIPALLTGNNDPARAKIGHCGAAQKMLWSEEWGGFPPEEFFARIDPVLLPVLRTMNAAKYTCDKPYGTLCKEWADELGLSENVVVGAGNVDSHQGAIGAGIDHGRVVINLGTSGCCMAVMPPEKLGGRIIEGVFGQADSCILPDLVGFETGLSAFGDVYAWFKRLLCYPTTEILAKNESIPAGLREQLVAQTQDAIMERLNNDAAALPLREDAPFATDWLNGRRSPAPNQRLWGSVMGLRIATSAPEIYYALVEATAFAVRTIIDHLVDNGIDVETIVGVGGISQKSPFVMQMLADATGKEINVSATKQSCALGSAICASVVGGVYPTIKDAQRALCQPIMRTYKPAPERAEHFARRYELYRRAGAFTEDILGVKQQ